jgi:hypothetical protein
MATHLRTASMPSELTTLPSPLRRRRPCGRTVDTGPTREQGGHGVDTGRRQPTPLRGCDQRDIVLIDGVRSERTAHACKFRTRSQTRQGDQLERMSDSVSLRTRQLFTRELSCCWKSV